MKPAPLQTLSRKLNYGGWMALWRSPSVWKCNHMLVWNVCAVQHSMWLSTCRWHVIRHLNILVCAGTLTHSHILDICHYALGKSPPSHLYKSFLSSFHLKPLSITLIFSLSSYPPALSFSIITLPPSLPPSLPPAGWWWGSWFLWFSPPPPLFPPSKKKRTGGAAGCWQAVSCSSAEPCNCVPWKETLVSGFLTCNTPLTLGYHKTPVRTSSTRTCFLSRCCFVMEQFSILLTAHSNESCHVLCLEMTSSFILEFCEVVVITYGSTLCKCMTQFESYWFR